MEGPASYIGVPCASRQSSEESKQCASSSTKHVWRAFFLQHEVTYVTGWSSGPANCAAASGGTLAFRNAAEWKRRSCTGGEEKKKGAKNRPQQREVRTFKNSSYVVVDDSLNSKACHKTTTPNCVTRTRRKDMAAGSATARAARECRDFGVLRGGGQALVYLFLFYCSWLK